MRLVETTRDQAGSKTIEGVQTTSIKGARMRLDAVRNNEPTTTIYDVPAGATIALEAKKKRATWRDVDRRNAKLEGEYPRASVTVAVTPTGATKTLVGALCREYALSVRVPMTKDGRLALTMTGSAWMASDVPGTEDYDVFAAAAIERQIVFGLASVVRKAVSGTQTTEVTSVSIAPLADDLFVVPAGWKSEKK